LHLELAPPSSHTFNLQVSGADARRDGHAIVPASTATNLIRPGDLLLVPGILATALTLAGLRRLRTLRDRRRVARGDSRPADTLTERGRTLHMIGAYRRATRVLQQSLQLRPHHAWTRLALARSHQHLALGRRAHHHAQHALEEADHAFHDAKGEGLNHTLIAEAAFIAACAACTLNRDSDALVWLELAYCHNSAVAAWVHNEPALARLRSHPTYRRLLRENIGLRDDPLAP
jgi:tetratricopeptide (TPR) repeat protein